MLNTQLPQHAVRYLNQVLGDNAMHLADNDLVEIAGLAFVFLVNQWLVGKARRHVLPGEGDDSNDDDA